ncbi:MAG: methyltransferase domain-containing protein [Solirubrobacteraceae bacterium]
MSAEERGRPLLPDEKAQDYVDFYRRIGEAQLEEAYYRRHGYAVARHHLLLGLLAPHAKRGDALLDVGCASGYYTTRYLVRGGSAVGIDVAESSLTLARQRASRAGVEARCEFRAGDLRSLPADDGSFDVVLATEVLEHVREQEQALRELARVVRPGGTLIVSSPSVLDPLSTRKRLAARKARTPQDAGVQVEQLGYNESLTAAGIAHGAYFHDAFTLPQLRSLLPAELEVARLHSLLFVPPRMWTYGFLACEALLRRLPWRRAAPAPTEEGPLDIPGAYAEARALMEWTRALWRIPVLREVGSGVLLVARRTGRAP